jgi:hypothetical protein
MARFQNREDLQRQINYLTVEHQQLQAALDEIADIACNEAEDPEPR